MFRFLFCCVLLLFPKAARPETTVLWRTTLTGRNVCSLGGRLLSLPPQINTPVRVWAGLLRDPAGGPFAEELQLQHFQQVVARFLVWKRELNTTDASVEISKRLEHAGTFQPSYFDVAVVQCENKPALQWMIDHDLDGALEYSGNVTFNRNPVADSVAASPDHWLRLSLVTSANTAEIFDASPPRIENPPDIGDCAKSSSGLSQNPIERLKNRLVTLDAPLTRKRQLSEIVAAADELILELERQYGADAKQLAEPLYRKGRALGYQELPDVVARTPVASPTQLNREFEATFARLEGLVDVTQPKYVLLAVRRERRRGYHGAALELLEMYRRKHPQPGWYHKKRRDLLRELKLPLIAQQAAADLWCSGVRPARPVPVIFRMDHGARQTVLGVSWKKSLPWRTDSLRLRRISPLLSEGVAWLPVNTTHEVELAPDQVYRFNTDAAMIQCGSVVRLRAVSQIDQ